MKINFLKTLFICGLFGLLVTHQLLASDEVVASLSEGACWFQEKDDFIKVSSFNDKKAFQLSKESLLLNLNEKLQSKFQTQKMNQKTILNLHCSGIGHSFVAKSLSDNLCVWFYLKDDELELRSVGGVEDEKGAFCEGFKWGEGLLGLHSLMKIDEIKSHSIYELYIEDETKITTDLYKIKLKKEFHGQEKQIFNELKKIQGIRYIELNKYQHSVGEWATLD